MPGHSPEPNPHHKILKHHEPKPTFSKAQLFPIDEAEDFYDPFSDLSLFLSKKIKSELSTLGSSKKWNMQIQRELMAKILPEFRTKFPKYRLGGTALKKVWEKVSYYYNKVQSEKEAFNSEGKLDVEYMIRENLRTYPIKEAPTDVPPYNCAHQVATKISECIATLDNQRPNLDELTKTIWAVQKHLLTNLSPTLAKSPYEVYDDVDKLIIKSLLEKATTHAHLGARELATALQEELALLEDISKLSRDNKLTSILSILTSERLYPRIPFHQLLTSEEMRNLEKFVERHINADYTAKNLSFDSFHLDLVQRLLSLYPLAISLPRDISDETLRASVKYIYFSRTQSPLNSCPVIPQSLLIFINSVMHFEDNQNNLAHLQDQVALAYREALDLPHFAMADSLPFEILIWKLINEKERILDQISPQILRRLQKEIAGVYLDNPRHSFRSATNTLLQFFKQVRKLDLSHKDHESKITNWVIQNDMLCRFLHFDPQCPLLNLIQTQWQELKLSEKSVDHQEFMSHCYEKSLEVLPQLRPYKEELHTRLWILYKYTWYNLLVSSEESTYDRFVKWHSANLSKKNPIDLNKLIRNKLPLTPHRTPKQNH